MTTVHAELTADRAVMRRDEFEHLVELARRTEPVEVRIRDKNDRDEIARLASEGGAFDLWNELGENTFFADRSLAELASAQRLEPLREGVALPRIFAEDEDVDKFLEPIYNSRK